MVRKLKNLQTGEVVQVDGKIPERYYVNVEDDETMYEYICAKLNNKVYQLIDGEIPYVIDRDRKSEFEQENGVQIDRRFNADYIN